MSQGIALLVVIAVLYLLLNVSPKAAAFLAAIVGLLLYAQLPKQ